MKAVCLAFLLLNVSLSVHAVAQTKGSFNYLTASTDKFLGKKVTVFISNVTLPERNAGLGHNFKVYLVDTCGSDGNDFAYGLVKVSMEDAAGFVKRYSNKGGKFTARSAVGVFKERDFDDNYQVSVPYYLDMTKE